MEHVNLSSINYQLFLKYDRRYGTGYNHLRKDGCVCFINALLMFCVRLINRTFDDRDTFGFEFIHTIKLIKLI